MRNTPDASTAGGDIAAQRTGTTDALPTGMVVLLHLKELPGGRRRDEYLGVFESADAAKRHLGLRVVPAPAWRDLAPTGGPFVSVCLYGMKPKSVLRAPHSQTEAFAILEFS